MPSYRVGRDRKGRLRLGFAVALVAVAAAVVLSGPLGGAQAGQPNQADLRVTKSDSPDPVMVGDELTYTIEVTNLGPAAATNVTLRDTLPAAVDFVSASAGCTRQGRRVDCDLGTLAASGGGASETVTIRVRPQRDGTIRNTARADSAEADPQAQNSSDTEETRVNPRPGPPPAATCRGLPATKVGTAGSDQLTGTGGPDVIAAFAGNDLIVGLAGPDVICAHRGNDDVGAGPQGDRVFGGAGGDEVFGRSGPDLLRGNTGNDALRGNRGNDRLRGGDGSDLCRGGPGFDSQRGCER
jgi:uncharacterized repeat protein (TIGR01451 family)